MEEVKIKTEGQYAGHSVKQNKSVDVNFKVPYSELTSYIQSIQMLNENVEVIAKIGSDKPLRLGSFMINNINIGNDGEGKIKLNSQLDFVDSEAISQLANRNDEPLKLLFKAQIESEDEDEEEEDEE